jgi:hypothetical protein
MRVPFPAIAERVAQGGADDEILQWCYAQGFRPTQAEIDDWNSTFSTPLTVDVVTIDDDLWALALRSVLESYGITIHLRSAARASQVVRLLNGSTPLSEHVILMCHGVEEGIHLPELSPVLAAEEHYKGPLSAANLREFLRLPDRFVLNTGCSLGKPEYADAFLSAGCQAYVGPTGDPEGDAALFYALHFFYAYHCRGTTIREAHEKASSHDEQTGMFRLHERQHRPDESGIPDSGDPLPPHRGRALLSVDAQAEEENRFGGVVEGTIPSDAGGDRELAQDSADPRAYGADIPAGDLPHAARHAPSQAIDRPGFRA